MPSLIFSSATPVSSTSATPFRTPLDEYLLIVNELQDELTPEKAEFFEDRRDLEPWAAKKFTRKTGLAVVRANERYSDAEFPWAKAEVDFETEDGSNGETKTVHPNAVSGWGDPETEEPPLYVTAQAMWGLGVTGRSLVVGPDGVVVLELDENPALRWADLDPARIAAARAANPSLANRRYRVVPAEGHAL